MRATYAAPRVGRATKVRLRKDTAAARKRYRATFEAESTFFVPRIPELALTTQARFWGEAEYMVRDCIATWLEITSDSFDVELVDARS